MTEAAEAFLGAIADRDATSASYSRAIEQELLRMLGEGLKECFDLQLLFDEVDLGETDRSLFGQLTEYRSLLGAFNRVGQEVRAKIQELASIRRGIDDLERRVGQPLRAKAGP